MASRIQYKDFDDPDRFDMTAQGDTIEDGCEMEKAYDGDYVLFERYDELNDEYQKLIKRLEAVEEAING